MLKYFFDLDRRVMIIENYSECKYQSMIDYFGDLDKIVFIYDLVIL